MGILGDPIWLVATRGTGYATFNVDIDTGNLIMTYPDDYDGPVFLVNENGELEVIPNGSN